MARQSTRKKPSNASRVTTPIVAQAVFAAPRRSVRSRPSPWSAPSKKQQTITQMNPFFSIFHPDDLPNDLSYENDDPQLPAPESPRPRKRQKVTPTNKNTLEMSDPNHKIRTRSTAAQKNQMAECSLSRENARSEGAARLKAMPKTPIPRDKVIPSSQSPAETPMSIRSRRDGKDTFQSPLQERSVNITPRRSNLRGNSAKINENEFASRWEGHECSYSTTPIVPFKLPSSVKKSSTQSCTQPRSSYLDAPSEVMCIVLDSEKENPPSQTSTNLQIFGSNDQNIDANQVNFDVGAETQEAIASLQSESCAHSRNNPFQTPSRVKQNDCSEDRASSPQIAISSKNPQDQQQSSGSPKSSQARSHPKETSNSASASALPQSEPQKFSRHAIPQYSQIRQRHCHQDVQQTPSIPSSSPSALSPSPQPQQQISTSSAATTIPTQPLSWTPLRSKPVPPSQATTIDTTQASTSNKRRKASTTIPDSSPPEPPTSNTRPPPLQLTQSIPSSSPLPNQLEEGDLGAYEWRSGPLHESQVLPESQMQGSLARPPEGWEEWSLEDEEDGL